MAEILFTNVNVFDGTGKDRFAGNVRVIDQRIVEVSRENAQPGGAEVIDGHGGTLMPGLIESHAHYDFGASIGRIPENVFRLTPVERMLSAVYAARTMLEYGFTSGYSAGCFGDVRSEIALKQEIERGGIPGPRMKACAGQWWPALALPESKAPFGLLDRDKRSPAPGAARDHVKAMADAGVEIIKLGLNGESGLLHGTTRTPLFYEEELEAAMDEVRKAGLESSAHAYTDESIQMALRHGVRTLYHCSFMEPSTLDLMAARRHDIFVAPGPGVLWNTIHDPFGYGFNADTVEKMESQITLDGTRTLMPELRARGMRVLPGGDYGFPWNPVGCNALDHALFVSEYGFTEAETLHAATALGGEIMGMGDELGQVKPGFLADLLLIDGDPTQDITLLQNAERIRIVMKDGRFCKRGAVGPVMA